MAEPFKDWMARGLDQAVTTSTIVRGLPVLVHNTRPDVTTEDVLRRLDHVADRARQERFCRRAEIEFGLAVPDGAPILERALATLDAPDEAVAPSIDPTLAARRVAQGDLEALAAPAWLKRVIARRRDHGR